MTLLDPYSRFCHNIGKYLYIYLYFREKLRGIRVKTSHKKGNRPPIRWGYLNRASINVKNDYQSISITLTTLIPTFNCSLKLKFSVRLFVSRSGSQNFFRPYNSNKALFLLIGDHYSPIWDFFIHGCPQGSLEKMTKIKLFAILSIFSKLLCGPLWMKKSQIGL